MSMRFATASTYTAGAADTDRAAHTLRRMLRTIAQVCDRAVSAGRTGWRRVRPISGDAGMSTAEYAVGTIAACAFAAVLYQVVTGDSIVSALRDLITSALSTLS